jgi:hypothetical protein
VTVPMGGGQDRRTLAEWEVRLLGKSAPAVFTSSDLTGLAEPVRRHLSRRIAHGTPLSCCARLSMRGSIKLGRWLPFRAEQVLNPHEGFVWAARVAGVIVGSDQYIDGVGQMNWKLAGLVTVAHEDGPDVSRSAAGRGGAEAVWLPTALLPRFGVRWSAQDETHITVHHHLGETPIDVHYLLGPDGQIKSFVFDRWGDPEQSDQWAWHPFGGEFAEHRTFSGVNIPSKGRVGWHFGTDRWPTSEFFRYEITSLHFSS